ncbi:MAG: M48 family metalloprotease [Terriglobales bacterium]
MWRLARFGVVGLEALLCLGLGSAVAQTSPGCAPLPPYEATAGTASLTPQQEMWLAEAMQAQSAGHLDGVTDLQLNAELQKVMARLTAALPPLGYPVQVQLLLSDFPDAFDLAAGQVYITRPLISLLHNQDELAGILAHELGHAYVHQLADIYAASATRNLGVSEYGSDNASFLKIYHRWVTFNERHEDKSHPKDLEIQEAADRTAFQILRAAGYDPRGLPASFDRLSGTKGDTGNWFSTAFGTTRPDAQRLRTMLAAVASAGPGCPPAPALSDADFHRWQADLVAYQQPDGASALPGLATVTHLPPLHDNYQQLLFSQDGRYLLAAERGGIWVLTVHPLALAFHVDEPEILAPLFTPDSTAVVFNTRDGRVERWDIATKSRTLLRQVVPADPGCEFSSPTPTGEALACLRSNGAVQLLDVATSAVRFELPPGGFAGWDLSPDGRYWVIKQASGGVVVDLTAARRISVPGAMQALVNQRFSFVSGSEALGTDDPFQKNWKRVQFPTGKVEQTYRLGRADIVAETHGPLVIARPVNGYPAGVLDPVTGHELFSSETTDSDGYDNLFAGETKDGAIALVAYSPGSLSQAATLTLPTAPLEAVPDAGASPDLRWLAVSTLSRGAIWDLSSNQAPATVGGFSSHFFSGSKLWVILAPTQQQRDDARGTYSIFAPGNEVEFDLATMTRQVLPAQPKNHIASFVSGKEMVLYFSSPSDAWMEVHDPDSGRTLWQQKLGHETPRTIPSLGGGDWIQAHSLNSDAAREALDADPAAKAQWQAQAKTDIGLWLELLDPETGKSARHWLLDPAPDISRAFRLGSNFYLTDDAHRTLEYDAVTGKLKQVWFGDAIAASPTAGSFILETNPRELELHAAGEASSRQRYQFPKDAVFAQFSADGARLLVLTRDQTVYILNMPAKPGV